MIRSLAPILRLLELAAWSFLTFRLHPLSPFWNRAVIRMAQLRRPT